jgi:DNA N-6-adenine-methyltransferase (Dam)
MTPTPSDEWYTPPAVIEDARTVMGRIDCDPASSIVAQGIVKAGVAHYLGHSDGITAKWTGAVWLNPPYSRAGPFVNALIRKYRDGEIEQAILLTNACTDTRWFHAAWRASQAKLLTLDRLHFWRADPSDARRSRQGQAFFYFGSNVPAFIRTFGKYGIAI